MKPNQQSSVTSETPAPSSRTFAGVARHTRASIFALAAFLLPGLQNLNAQIDVNSDGTLLLSNSNGRQTYSSMTLTTNSTLDFGSVSTPASDSLRLTSGAPTVSTSIGTLFGLAADASSATKVSLLSPTDAAFGGGNSIGGISLYGSGSGTSAVSFASSISITPVPEPASSALIGALGLLGFIGYRERRRLAGLGRKSSATGSPVRPNDGFQVLYRNPDATFDLNS